MDQLTFYILDVFAESKYAGNQLGVIRGGQDLTDEEMQALALEIGYSETTFIISEEEHHGSYDVRIFTPEEEVPFAGHPTLGTAWLIQQEIIRKPVEKVTLNLEVGRIPVTFTYEDGQVKELWMHQKLPVFTRTFDPEVIGDAFHLNIGDIDEKFPIEEVSTGLPFIIVPLKTREAIKRLITDRPKYFELIKNIDAKAVLFFCPQPYDDSNDLNARMLADYYGVPEDPATGSANGCLAAWLVKNRYFGTAEIDIKVEQGYEINRPSVLYLKACEKDDEIEVHVGGKVAMVARGELV